MSSENSVSVPANVALAPCFAHNPDVGVDCQQSLTSDMTEVTHTNAIVGAYPGGFYWVMSWFVGATPLISVLLMRIVNAVLFVGIAAVTLKLSEPQWRAPLLLGIAVTIVPLGMSIIASTNPSSWTLFAPAFIYVLARTLLRATNASRAVLVGALTVGIVALSSSARSDAAIFAIFAVVLAPLSEWKRATAKRTFVITALSSLIIALLSVLGSGQASGAASGKMVESETTGSSIGLLLRNLSDLPSLLFGSFGTWDLGWFDTPMPSMVWLPQLLAFGALLMSASLLKRSRRELIIPVVAFGTLAFVALTISQLSGAVIGATVQPRYVFPLMCLALVALLSTSTSQVVLVRQQLTTTLIIVAVANVTAVGATLIRYSAGTGGDALSRVSGAQAVGMILVLIASTIGSIGFAWAARSVFNFSELSSIPGHARH